MFNRSTVFVGSLIAALICYFIHFQTGAVIALIIGILFELAFWFHFIGKDATKKSLHSAKDE